MKDEQEIMWQELIPHRHMRMINLYVKAYMDSGMSNKDAVKRVTDDLGKYLYEFTIPIWQQIKH